MTAAMTTPHDWLIPLSRTNMTLREARASLAAVADPPSSMPLAIRLVENPEFDLGGFGFFKGRVTLEQHDCIHIALGRGLLPIDEAFVIGFTMGSTDRVSTFEAKLFTWIAGKIYPKGYQFDARMAQVTKDAVALAYVSDVADLAKVDFAAMADMTLGEVRTAIGVEPDLLAAYYRIEARRYPDSVPSVRSAAGTR